MFCDVARLAGVSPASGPGEALIGSILVPAFNGYPTDIRLLSITGALGTLGLILLGIAGFQQARCFISGRDEQLCSKRCEDGGELCP